MSKRKSGISTEFHNAAVDKAYELGRQDAFNEVRANQWFAEQVEAKRAPTEVEKEADSIDAIRAGVLDLLEQKVFEAEERQMAEYEKQLWGEKSEPESLRGSALDEAKGLITGDRNNTYGEPHQDFQRSADALTAIMGDKLAPGQRFHAHEIAQIVILIKLSRLQWTPTKRDSWVDIAGYAGCGFEAAVLTQDPEHVG